MQQRKKYGLNTRRVLMRKRRLLDNDVNPSSSISDELKRLQAFERECLAKLLNKFRRGG